MPDLRDQISEALKGHGADYVEVRIEEGESTRLLYRQRVGRRGNDHQPGRKRPGAGERRMGVRQLQQYRRSDEIGWGTRCGRQGW